MVLKDPKVDRSLMKLRLGYGRSRDLFSDPHFGLFGNTFKNIVLDFVRILCPDTDLLEQDFGTDVCDV